MGRSSPPCSSVSWMPDPENFVHIVSFTHPLVEAEEEKTGAKHAGNVGPNINHATGRGSGNRGGGTNKGISTASL